MCLGVTLGPTFQQELAYSVMPIAAGVVLQGTETEVTQQKLAGSGWGVERGWTPEREACALQGPPPSAVGPGQAPSFLASVSSIISSSQDCYENGIQ